VPPSSVGDFTGVFLMANKINWEKIGVYVAICASFLTVINHVIDSKERIAKLEAKVANLEGK